MDPAVVLRMWYVDERVTAKPNGDGLAVKYDQQGRERARLEGYTIHVNCCSVDDPANKL